MKALNWNLTENFICIGGKCKHNCCSESWLIPIDEETYEYYAGLDTELGDMIRDSIYEYKKDNYAFKRSDAGKCKFLNEQGLCDLVLKLGPDKLCDTCKLYPRIVNMLSDHLSIAYFSLSCEEVCRKVIFNKKKGNIKIKFVDEPAQKVDLNSLLSALDPFNAIRLSSLTTALEIMQNRELNVYDRVALGVFYLDIVCKGLNEIWNKIPVELTNKKSLYLDYDRFPDSVKYEIENKSRELEGLSNSFKDREYLKNTLKGIKAFKDTQNLQFVKFLIEVFRRLIYNSSHTILKHVTDKCGSILHRLPENELGKRELRKHISTPFFELQLEQFATYCLFVLFFDDKLVFVPRKSEADFMRPVRSMVYYFCIMSGYLSLLSIDEKLNSDKCNEIYGELYKTFEHTKGNTLYLCEHMKADGFEDIMDLISLL